MSKLSGKHSNQARINGAQSKGPTTPEGKAISSQNATTHGLTSNRTLVPPADQPEYDALKSQLTNQLKPIGAIERILFDSLLHHAWKMRAFRFVEAELIARNNGEDPYLSDDPAVVKKAERIRRYAAQIERHFHKDLRELHTLQNNRLNRDQFLGKLIPPDGPVLADSTEFAKRTQRVVKNATHVLTEQATSEGKTFELRVKELFSVIRPDANQDS